MSGLCPRVSVVVPAHNEEECIEDCLRALLNQDYPRDRYNIFVVDNASTDATAALIACYPVTLIREPISGVARARNAGIRATRGECVAFTDADCVPCSEWLSALVEGWEDPAIGCFVGEITGRPSSRWVAQYVQDRELICQRKLLSASLPVAATGSIAFRRSVFPVVGVFDESFCCGEDADFTWRLQKWGGYGIRYNPRALVEHPHPESLQELLRRTRHEGLGLAAFRLRHADDIRRPQLSRSHYRTAMVMAALGLAKYPMRVAVERRRAMPVHKALSFPLADKLCSLALMSGISSGLPRGRPPAVSPARREASSLPCAARDYEDRLILDLSQDPLFRHSSETLTSRVRQELGVLCEQILAVLPDASVLLTGSLSAGEGRWQAVQDGIVSHSDYDLVVLSRVLPAMALPALRRRLQPHLLQYPQAADVDLAYVWQPLLKHGWITTGGRLIAGDPGRIRLLPCLPAPRASSPLIRSFLSLAGAPLAPDLFSDRLSKALVLGAQAFLLNLCQGQPRREWIGLLSLSVICKRVREHPDVLDRESVEDIDRAVAWLSGESLPPWTWQDQRRILGTLRRIKARVPEPAGWRHGLVRILKTRQGLQAGRKQPHAASRLLETIEALAACWVDGTAPNAARLADMPRSRNGLDGATPVDHYRRLHAELAEAVEFYPHKLRWRRCQQCLD